MRIIGHGVDLVEIARIGAMLERHPDRFPERVFTAQERCDAMPQRRRVEHLAGRFAAKEGVLKALGTGLTQGIAWTDVEVVRDGAGKPLVRLHGAAAAQAALQGVREILLSISHTKTHAIASAIAVGDGGA
ncbi:MAG: holo-ACP synthase [Planctomycetota bacterium]|nr:holo-ACP synthase [Planctomycetota bacterium]